MLVAIMRLQVLPRVVDLLDLGSFYHNDGHGLAQPAHRRLRGA
jgi:hypothetical protein